jgi:hypothetical protein
VLTHPIISGNAGQGVKIGLESTTDVLVIGNYIGTDVTGLKPIANSLGISIGEGTHHTFIGGSTTGERNLIGGNDRGLDIYGMGTDYNFIMGNFIGTDATGAGTLANHNLGINDNGGDHNFIQRNIIAYNEKSEIAINSGNDNSIHHNTIIGSDKIKIGTDGGYNNLWDDGKEGNYWSDYAGKDANVDGIGDTRYAITPNGVDRYPLIKPPG